MNKNSGIYLILGAILTLIAIDYYPTFIWLYGRYTSADAHYSHGFLVPFVTGFLIWIKRQELKKTSWRGNSAGSILIIISLIIHALSISMGVYFLSGLSLLFLLFGISLYLFGNEITKIIRFPLFFLFFMIPAPLILINAVSFKMSKFVIKSSLFILSIFSDIPIMNEGFQLIFPKGTLVIESPCSGLRSLIVMLALASIFAYLLRARFLKRIFLFIMAFPVAFISNLLRVVVLCMVALIFGIEKVTGFIHDFTTYMVFLTELAGMWLLWSLLSK